MSQNGISAGMGQLKPDQCFDIPFASSQKSSMYESIAYRIGDLLKSPSRFFMMLILKIYKLSPGYHIEFSKQAMLDNIVRYSLKSLCLLIGLIGTVTFSSLYLLGGLLQYGLQSQYPRYEIEGRWVDRDLRFPRKQRCRGIHPSGHRIDRLDQVPEAPRTGSRPDQSLTLLVAQRVSKRS